MIQVKVDERYSSKNVQFEVECVTEGSEEQISSTTAGGLQYSAGLAWSDLIAAVHAGTHIPMEGILSVTFCGRGAVKFGGNITAMGSSSLPDVQLALMTIQQRAVAFAVMFQTRPAVFHITYKATVIGVENREP